MSGQQIAARYVCSINQIQVFGVADREIDFNWIQLRNRCEERFRAHKVSNLSHSLASNAVHEGANLSKVQVQFGRPEGGFGSSYRRIRCNHRRVRLLRLLFLVVELTLGYCSRLRQRSISLQIDLGEALLRLCLRKLALRLLYLRVRLVHGRLKGTWVNLKENLIPGYRRAFTVILGDQVSTHVRLYLNVHKTIQCTDPSARE